MINSVQAAVDLAEEIRNGRIVYTTDGRRFLFDGSYKIETKTLIVDKKHMYRAILKSREYIKEDQNDQDQELKRCYICSI